MKYTYTKWIHETFFIDKFDCKELFMGDWNVAASLKPIL